MIRLESLRRELPFAGRGAAARGIPAASLGPMSICGAHLSPVLWAGCPTSGLCLRAVRASQTGSSEGSGLVSWSQGWVRQERLGGARALTQGRVTQREAMCTPPWCTWNKSKLENRSTLRAELEQNRSPSLAAHTSLQEPACIRPE